MECSCAGNTGITVADVRIASVIDEVGMEQIDDRKQDDAIGSPVESVESVTLIDVARVAGVAPMTVSRALHRPELVRSATQKKVLDAVRATGYVPNMLAGDRKSTRLNSSHITISYAVFCLK